MIIEKFDVEFIGIMPTEKKEEIQQKILSQSEKIHAVSLNMTGDFKTTTLFDVAEYIRIISEIISDETPFFYGAKTDRNFITSQRKIEIAISDNNTDFKEEDYTIEV